MGTGHLYSWAVTQSQTEDAEAGPGGGSPRSPQTHLPRGRGRVQTQEAPDPSAPRGRDSLFSLFLLPMSLSPVGRCRRLPSLKLWFLKPRPRASPGLFCVPHSPEARTPPGRTPAPGRACGAFFTCRFFLPKLGSPPPGGSPGSRVTGHNTGWGSQETGGGSQEKAACSEQADTLRSKERAPES